MTEGIISIDQQPTHYAVAFLRKMKPTDLQCSYINQTNVREHVGSEKKQHLRRKTVEAVFSIFLSDTSTYLDPYCHRNAKQKNEQEKVTDLV